MINKLIFLASVVLFSSCGVVTKARYGNGLKCNLEWFKKAEKGEEIKEYQAKMAEKKINATKINSNNVIIENSQFQDNNFEVSELDKSNQLKTIKINNIKFDSTQKKKNKIKNKLLEYKDGDYEQNAVWAFVVFLLSVLGLIGTAIWIISLPLTLNAIFLAFLLVLIFIFFIVTLVYSYFLAVESRENIKNSKYKLKGKVLVSIIVYIPFITLLILFFSLMLQE